MIKKLVYQDINIASAQFKKTFAVKKLSSFVKCSFKDFCTFFAKYLTEIYLVIMPKDDRIKKRTKYHKKRKGFFGKERKLEEVGRYTWCCSRSC